MKRWKVVSSMSSLVLLFFIVYFFVPMRSALVFYEGRTDQIAAYLPLRQGDQFQIIFVHSIHRTDVTETYEIEQDGTIHQTAMFFSQYGIGMPSTVEPHESLVYQNGRYELTGIERTFPSMNIRNGKTVSEHRLRYKRQGQSPRCVYFNTFFEPGDWYEVKMKRLTMNEQRGVKIDDKKEKRRCRFDGER